MREAFWARKIDSFVHSLILIHKTLIEFHKNI